jgi:hypothetical protein
MGQVVCRGLMNPRMGRRVGPLATTLSASTSGGGFAVQPFDWAMLLTATAIFPVATFTMSTYDGTLGALVLSTLVLVLVAAVGRPRPRRSPLGLQ